MCYITLKTMANETGNRVIKGEQKIAICDCFETAMELLTSRIAERERQGYATETLIDNTETIYNEPLQVKDVEIAYAIQAKNATTIEQYRIFAEWDDEDAGAWEEFRDEYYLWDE